MSTPLIIIASILAVVTVVMSFAMLKKNKELRPEIRKHQPHQPKKKNNKTRKGKK